MANILATNFGFVSKLSRLKQNGQHFADNILIYILLNFFVIQLSLQFDLVSPVENYPAFVQVMVWSSKYDKPLPEPLIKKVTDTILLRYSEFMN